MRYITSGGLSGDDRAAGLQSSWGRAALAVLVLLSTASLIAVFAGAQSTTDFEWDNTTWRHRVGMEVTAQTDTENWPIERKMNFTALLEGEGEAGEFDNDSIRVLAYDANGDVMYEVPYQFDPGEGYNDATNAHGTLTFMLNGTTTDGTTRHFFVYFDSLSNGEKPAVSFPENMEHSFGGEEVSINNSKFRYRIDTERGDNVSGLYEVHDESFDTVLEAVSESERPAEYTEFTNGTHEFTFNLSNNASVRTGPHRITVTQRGFIDFYNISGESQDLFLEKKYIFYNNSGEGTSAFVKIDQDVRNSGSQGFGFRSTLAGSTALDVNRTWGSTDDIVINFFNETDPFSYVRVHTSNFHAGIVNINESREDFLSTNYLDERKRIGTNMTEITLQPDEEVSQTTFFSAGSFTEDGSTEFRNLVDMFRNQPAVVEKDADTYSASVNTSTNETVYNRNEPVEITGNITSDTFNVTSNVSAVLDMNTSTTSDDETVILSHNGDGWTVWSGIFQLQTDSNVGDWTLNVTAETDDSVVVDRDTRQFTVTDEYFADITLRNQFAVEGDLVKANLTLETFRQDSRIENAVARCSIDGSELQNVSEFGNGIYRANFTAPSPPGDYTLACNGSKSGNLGNATAILTSETATVAVNTSFVPPSFEAGEVALEESQNFTFVMNVSNPDNGTARNTNVTLTPPTDWKLNTSEASCGDIGIGGFCSRNVSARIPADTAPDDFTVNTSAEWVNPDGTTDGSNASFPVEVLSNPVVNVSEKLVEGRFGGGRSRQIGDFTALSIGNANLSNVNFTCEADSGQVCDNFSTSFSPPNASTIEKGGNQSVNVTVHVPKEYDPGLYNGTINVSADSSFDTLNVSVDVIGTTTVSTDTIPADHVSADNVTLRNNQTIQFDTNSTNTGAAFAFSTNASVSLPSGWGANSSRRECGDLNTSESCTRTFFPEIPNATDPGNYTVTADTDWLNPDGTTDSSTHDITVVVDSNPFQDVPEELVNGTVSVDTEEEIGNLTVVSLGNANLSSVNFTCESGEVCDNFTTGFEPTNISAIEPGENRSVRVNVSVPARFAAGQYSGTLNVSSTGGFDLLTVNVTVPEERRWEMEPLSCETNSAPSAGNACTPVINNTGNADLNITIAPSSVNNTAPEPQNISVPFGSSKEFNMTYNVTGVEDQVHNATYNVSTVNAATPQWRSLGVTVLPAVKPGIDVFLEPDLIRQNDTVTVLANVTATSGFPMDRVLLNVTQPGNVSVLDSMERVKNYSSDQSLWRLDYPNGTQAALANTTFRGSYGVNISANDTLGNEDFNATTLTVAAKLSTTLETLSSTYDQGETGSITYNLSGFTGEGLGGAEVDLTVLDPDQFTVPLDGSNPFTTSSGTKQGYIDPRPTFSLADDATIGVYDLKANATWNDTVTDRTEEKDVSTTFAVGKGGDFKVRWDTGSVWFPEANFTAYTSTSKDDERIDVDRINLTVFDPDGNTFFTFNDSEVKNRGTGLYKAWEEIPDDPELGVYWSKLVVEDGDEEAVRFQSFRMAEEEVATGPFDIRATLLEQTEEQGEFLDFNLTLANMGDNSGDSKVTYWVTQNGTEYSFVSETIFTPANNNMTIPRSIFIFNDQSPGKYTLNAKVEPLESSMTPATTSVTFKVEEAEDEPSDEQETVTETEERQRDSDDAAAPDDDQEQPNMTVIDAPEEINLARGTSTYKSVIVANTGDTVLENLTLGVVGVPSSWTSIDPSEPVQLSRQDTQTFSVLFEVPPDAERTDYNATFLATSDLATTRSSADVRVFRSIQNKIREDIDRVHDRWRELRTRMEILRSEGADVSGVESYVTEIEAKIESANQSVEEGDFDAALQDVSEADSLVADGEEALSKVEAPGGRQEFKLFPVLIGVLILLAMVLTVVYFVKVRSVRPFEETQDRIHDIFREMKKRSMREEKELKEKKQKTTRLIQLLEAQHEEGIMEEDTYQELKSSAEEKLRRINRELEDS